MSAQDKLKKQILGQNLTGKWSGAGHGSSEANAEDMAKILSDIGITDIKQFGKVAKYDPVSEAYKTYNGYRVTKTTADDSGNRGGDYIYSRPTNKIDDEGNVVYETAMVPEGAKLESQYGFYRDLGEAGYELIPVDSSKVVNRDGVLFGPTGTTTFGNKETGKEVSTTYHGQQYQNGNFFGGTYAGKGNTGYGVQFDAQGNPIFYTQGASSSDMGQLAPFLALASFVPGLQPFAMAANAAIAAKQGNPLGVITSLAGMGDLAGISGMADVANAAKFAGAVQGGDPLGILMSGANLGGVNLGSTDIGGISLGDIGKGIGAIKAIDSGNPLALLPYINSVLPKDGGLTSSIGSGGEGYVGPTFQDTTGLDEGPIIPVNEAPAPDVIDQLLNSGMPSPDEDFMPTLPAPTETPTGPGYYNEITGEFIPGEGPLQGPLGPETGNIDPNKEWEYSLTKPGVWTSKDGEEIDLSYMPDRDTALTGKELMEKAGAMPGGTKAPTVKAPTGAPGAKPAVPAKPGTTGNLGKVIAGVGSALGAGTAGTAVNPAVDAITNLANQQQMQQRQAQQNNLVSMLLGSQDKGADIKSFKEILGEDLFGGKYVPPSAGGAQSDESADYGRDDDSGTASQNEGDGLFYGGGHVDDFDVDALLQILRS